MRITSLVLVSLMLSVTGQSRATGLATCDSGPESGWKPQEALVKSLTAQGWQVRQVKVDGGCYEVYALDHKGQKVEAYFHPVTLARVATTGD
jgi:hypothetical protein